MNKHLSASTRVLAYPSAVLAAAAAAALLPQLEPHRQALAAATDLSGEAIVVALLSTPFLALALSMRALVRRSARSIDSIARLCVQKFEQEDQSAPHTRETRVIKKYISKQKKQLDSQEDELRKLRHELKHARKKRDETSKAVRDFEGLLQNLNRVRAELHEDNERLRKELLESEEENDALRRQLRGSFKQGHAPDSPHSLQGEKNRAFKHYPHSRSEGAPPHCGSMGKERA